MALKERIAFLSVTASLLVVAVGCGHAEDATAPAAAGPPPSAISETGKAKKIDPNLTPKQQELMRSTKGGQDP